MGSDGDESGHKSKPENPISSANTQTQVLDTDYSPSSGENFNDGGVQFDDTLPLDSDFLSETEVVREVYDVDTETQVLEDMDCTADEKEGILDSDAEGAEATEVLLSDGDDEVSDDGTTFFKVKDSNAEINIEDGAVGSDKEKLVCFYDQGTNEFLVESDALTEDEYNSGCVQRSFTSVHAASLRSSGIAADLSQTPKGAERNFAKRNSEAGPGQKQDNVKSPQPGTDGIRKDNGITIFSDQTPFVGTEVCELHQDHEAEKSHRNIQCNVGDETKRRIRKTRARKLFNESTPSGDEEMTSELDSPTKKTDSLWLLVSNHAVAGLSYVGSQEPGEQSQANALNTVDKFLFINDVELSGEVDPGENVRGKSPPMSSATGARTLAEGANFRSPVQTAGIFDWIDSREDERGGNFFSKRKDALLKGRRNMRKPHTHPCEPNHLTFSQTGSAFNRFGEEEDNSNPQIHQKIMSLIQSDSRLILNSSIRTRSQISKTLTKKNLLKEIGEELNTDLSGQQLETSASGGVLQDICDVGVDTQLAAEAMEALGCGPPASANHDVPDAHPLKRNLTEGSMRAATKKNAHLKHVSDSEGNTRQCKRTKKLSAKLNKGYPSSYEKQLKNSQAKRKETNWKHEEYLNTVKSFKGNVYSTRKSSETDKKWKMGRQFDETNIQEANEHHLSLMSNSFGELDETVTPVAHNTRQSVTTNSLKMAEIVLNHSHLVEVSVLGSKKRGSDSVIDAPEPVMDKVKRLKSRPHQIGKFSKNISRQEIKGTEALNEEIPKTNYTTKDAFSCPKGRRTRRRMSHALKNASEPHMPPENNHVTLSSGKLLTVSRVSVVNKKVLPKDQITSTHGTLTRSGRKYGVDYFRSPVEGAEGNDTAGSSKEMVQASGTPCTTTPSKELNAVSPVYAGDDHTKHSGKNSIIQSAIMRELIRLGAPEVARAPAWKDTRRRRDMASVCILFSHHLGEDIIKQQKKILARLGVPIVSSSSNATHFIADKFTRTRNMLEAIALGKPVVTHLWLESCGQACCFIDEKNYILRDSKKEKEIGFSMPVSLARACSSPLLQGKRVFITHNVKPDRELIANLVNAAKGQAIERIGRSVMKDDKVPNDLLVISCEEDYAVCASLLEKGAEVYSSELLLNGIVIQKLEYDRHRLFIDHVKRPLSSILLRNEDGDQFHPVTKHK